MVSSRKHRIQRIYNMLVEMGNGNFSHRLERLGENDDIEAIEMCLNMLSEEIQEFMVHESFAIIKGGGKHIVQMSFILDGRGNITMANQRSCDLLFQSFSDIIQQPFETLLTNTSKERWQATWNRLQQRDLADTSLELMFKTGKKLVLPSNCHITTYKVKGDEERKTLITVVMYSKEWELDKNNMIEFGNGQKSDRTKTIKLTYNDIRKIRKGHEMIKNNPEFDYSTLKDFSLLLGTNEFKLKYGFKQLYGTSVHQFIINERLRKAKILVQYSPFTLTSIAHKSGFKSLSHFSKAFKNHYGHSARSLRTQSLENK